MTKIIRIGMDTSKSVFVLHGVDAAERPVLRKKLRRRQVLEFFSRLEPTRVGLEACGAAHYWARALRALGHEVVLLPPQYVKPYVKRGKNDAADAEAICEAMSRPTMRFVPVKTAEQQAALMLVGTRDALIRRRTQVSNMIRGYAAEFGLVAAKGLDKIEPLLVRLAAADLPALARELFAAYAQEYAELKEKLQMIEARLMAWHRHDELSRRLVAVPGVGPIGAALTAMKVADPHAFRNGRNFAAWIGLTPKDHSTAGKTRLGVITRAGDEALRSVLVVGATSVIKQVGLGRGPASPWLAELVRRKPPKLAAVALANKTARILWKLMVSGERYDPARALAWGSQADGPGGDGVSGATARNRRQACPAEAASGRRKNSVPQPRQPSAGLAPSRPLRAACGGGLTASLDGVGARRSPRPQVGDEGMGVAVEPRDARSQPELVLSLRHTPEHPKSSRGAA